MGYTRTERQRMASPRENPSRSNAPHNDAAFAPARGFSANPSNILILNLGQLGDVVLSLPALAAIRSPFPGATIAVASGLAAGQAIELSGLADRIISVDRVALRDGPKLRSI